MPHPELKPFYDNIKEYTDLPKAELDIIEQFFAHYKDLEHGKWVKIEGWRGSEEAKKMILEGIERVNS